MSLVKDIELVKALLDTGVKSKDVDNMILRFARFMPSPSKLNAVSTIGMNPADKLAKWLSEREESRQ